MLLIADSGSTKTDWRLIDDHNKIHSFQTIGFSPYFQTTEIIAEEIKKNLLPKLNLHLPSSTFHLFYYGTGCSSPEKISIVKEALQNCFPKATIVVEHDMLGAARALCGKEQGIAAILGTGSNSCYFDGKEIKASAVSLGFILGDEGSGAHIGKTFIQAYLNKELSGAIADKFFSEYKIGIDEILDAVYKQPMPNRYLASFTKFIKQNIHEPELKNLVLECFKSFFDKQICKFSDYKSIHLHCVGSVAKHFSDILKEAAKEKGVIVGKIISAPIDGLVEYHSIAV